ncbi:unnamed protein product, partial [Bubo scandiacus]
MAEERGGRAGGRPEAPQGARLGGAAAEGGGARGSGVCRRGGGGGRLHTQAPRAKLAGGGWGVGGGGGQQAWRARRARLHGGGGRQQQRGGSGVRRGCCGGARRGPPRRGQRHRTLRGRGAGNRLDPGDPRRSCTDPLGSGATGSSKYIFLFLTKKNLTSRMKVNLKTFIFFIEPKGGFRGADAGDTNFKH